MTYRVMIVDDQEAFRRLALVTLEGDCDFEVIAEASDGHEAVMLTDETEPDLVLMDVEMPGMGGVQATSEILERHPAVKVVLMSMFDDQTYARVGLESGAVAFVAKTELSVDLLREKMKASGR